MSIGIYKITNKINNKCYIGQSIHIEERWTDEKYCAFEPTNPHYNSILSKAFRKYGIENFNFEILEKCPYEFLNEREKFYIQKYDSYYNGYNATTGGEGNSHNEIKITKEELLEIYDLLLNSSLSQKDIATKYNVGEDTISNINHGKTRIINGYSFPLRNNKNKKNYCCDCGIEILSSSIRCNSCAKKLRRVVERPNREELKNLIRTSNFSAIAKSFGVADNTIRKWCDSYNLPRRASEIKRFSEEEWNKI